MGKTCVICGKPSGMYPLCREHLTMKNEGTVVKCPDCGTWHYAKEICECQKPKTPPKKTYIEENVEKNDEITCLLCGEPSNGKHFCSKCWKENFATYGNEESKIKKITVVIDNHLKCEIIDKYGNRTYKTQNGMFVRSQQEKIIYDELYSRNIKVIYEPSVFYKNENGETEDLHPDFYLPDYNLYIEHWGYDSTDYIKTKKFKEGIYKAQGKKIAGTTGEDIKDIKTAIDKIFFENNINIE